MKKSRTLRRAAGEAPEAVTVTAVRIGVASSSPRNTEVRTGVLA